MTLIWTDLYQQEFFKLHLMKFSFFFSSIPNIDFEKAEPANFQTHVAIKLAIKD